MGTSQPLLTAETVTAATITDEQLVELLEDALYREWHTVAADCHIALAGVVTNPTRLRRQNARRSKKHPGYMAARQRCADRFNQILNSRAGGSK